MRIKGSIIEGKKKGAFLGYPTANIALKQPIEAGVYAGEVEVRGEKYRAAIFVSRDSLLEAHLLDFNGDIYGKFISVELGERIRDVMAFKNDKELKAQIKRDVELVIRQKEKEER